MANSNRVFGVVSDFLKQLVDEHGREVVYKILDKIISPEIANFLLKSKTTGWLLSGGSITVAQMLPNTPFGELLEETFREVVASLKDYLNDYKKGRVGSLSQNDVESIFQNAPQSLLMKADKAKLAYGVIKVGLLEARPDDGKKLLAWIHTLTDPKFSNQAFRIVNSMNISQLSNFANYDDEDKVVYIKELLYKEDEPEKEKSPSFVEKARYDFDTWISGSAESFTKRINDRAEELAKEDKEYLKQQKKVRKKRKSFRVTILKILFFPITYLLWLYQKLSNKKLRALPGIHKVKDNDILADDDLDYDNFNFSIRSGNGTTNNKTIFIIFLVLFLIAVSMISVCYILLT